MSNAADNMKDPRVVRQLGVEALANSLGLVGMANFFRQFDVGYGDYTKERGAIIGDSSVDEICAEIINARN